MLKITKRFYSTYENLYNFELLYRIPKCVDCKHFDKKKSLCVYYNEYYVFPRINQNKCGFYGKNYLYDISKIK